MSFILNNQDVENFSDVVKRKIELYQGNGVSAFPGGQFFELAYIQGRAEAYMEEVKAFGFSHVEISENCIDLPANNQHFLNIFRENILHKK